MFNTNKKQSSESHLPTRQEMIRRAQKKAVVYENKSSNSCMLSVILFVLLLIYALFRPKATSTSHATVILDIWFILIIIFFLLRSFFYLCKAQTYKDARNTLYPLGCKYPEEDIIVNLDITVTTVKHKETASQQYNRQRIEEQHPDRQNKKL